MSSFNQRRDEVLTPQDVFDVRGYLLEYIPTELANQILDEAQYWPKVSCKYEPLGEPTLMVASRYHIGTECCLLSPKIPEVRDASKIVKVCFKIESRDEGWIGQALRGQYQRSRTWSEAAIVRDFKDEYGVRADDETIRQALSIRERRSKQGPIGDWKLERPPGQWFYGALRQSLTLVNLNRDSDVWEIQRNLWGSRQCRLHETVWTRDLDEGVNEEAHFQATGSKLGLGFVRSLQAGDRIAVLAKAQFPAWMNWVKSVELEIYLSE
ncbi:hypothetical protein BDZ97DRAFT_1916334 [Flammula alnicola]|nr:hypothetical protein BDZ97DRAFT_1916334 [Flammula alnicola]